MFYPTYVNGDIMLFLETETSGAFAKSDLEVRPDPGKAFENSVKMAEQVGRYVAAQMRPMMDELGMDAEVQFGIKADGHGSVMIAMTPANGQILCKLTMKK